MMTVRSSTLLRRLLLVDAAISGATGVMMLAAAGLLASLLEVPAPLIRYSGLLLLPFAAMVLYFAKAERLSRGRVWTVILMNASWVLGSVVLLVTGWIDPNVFGVAFVVVQAIAVAGLAEFQYTALRAQSFIPNP
jgi:hypothetical protein